ncbi:MAG: ribonuclease Z [Pyrinomonadaceae bacterium]
MKLIVLGSGSTVPHPARTSSGYWLETSAGTVLLDCSATVPMRMAQESLDWPNLDAIWISHFHMDHCGGLGPLLAATKHVEHMKGRTKPLKIFGPSGLSRLIEGFSSANNYRLLEQPFPVEIAEVVERETFEIVPGVEAVTMSTPHTAESHAIHIRDVDDTTFVYSSDTAFTELISAFANRVDLLLLECTYIRDKPKNKHLELAEAVFLIRKAAPKRAVLTHFYPDWDEVDFAAEVAKFSPGIEIIEAVDGLVVSAGENVHFLS